MWSFTQDKESIFVRERYERMNGVEAARDRGHTKQRAGDLEREMIKVDETADEAQSPRSLRASEEGELGDVTRVLRAWKEGDEDALSELLPLVYDELHRVASAYLRLERSSHTLQPTALVHEVYLRLDRVTALDATDRKHFFAVAARAMRRILVDHARSQQAEKRVGAHRKLPLKEARLLTTDSAEGVIGVHEALEKLSASHPRPARLVELRFFGGLSEDEACEVMDVSRSTLSREWRFAKMWLYRQLKLQVSMA